MPEPELKNILPPKLFDIADRAGIATSRQIILLSLWDIKKNTNLSIEDIQLLKNVVSEHFRPRSIACDLLLEDSKITTGCNAINNILNGGLRKGTITELYGESGSGKTQLGIQAAAHNWPLCCAYICTEDQFPIKRFDEINKGIIKNSFKGNTDYGSSTFVEHLTESKDLLSCVRVRLPKLLTQNEFSLIVIDSVAAPFRVEHTDYIQRAEELRELASSLLQLAREFKLAVLCINQVTGAVDRAEDILPSLGLAWSNMVSTRLYLRKTFQTVKIKDAAIEYSSNVRVLSVMFAPDLPNCITEFIITPAGLQEI